MAPIETESRRALHELLRTIEEVDETYLGQTWGIQMPGDVVEGHRLMMHLLEGGLTSWLETDPDRPRFERIVTPTRKLMGDNPDAIYFEAPVRAGQRYRVRGARAGAVYFSITVEAGGAPGQLGARTAGTVNDETIDVGEDGRFEVTLGGPPQPRNWLDLPADACQITTRHYFEEANPVAADPTRHLGLTIEALDPPPGPAPRPTDGSVAAGIRRVAASLRSRTLGMPRPGEKAPPPFVSQVPNQLPPPVTPGDHPLAATDAAYSMAPYFAGPDQALVLSGRWPDCRCANVVLWNRFLQTYDYTSRRVSLNRAQTALEPDGSFRIVLAHEDPGLPNWLDTEGRPFGLLFFRFMLPESPIETPRAELVDLASIARR